MLVIRLFHNDVLTTDVISRRIVTDEELWELWVWEVVISYVQVHGETEKPPKSRIMGDGRGPDSNRVSPECE
jgi:hypothetical protein